MKCILSCNPHITINKMFKIPLIIIVIIMSVVLVVEMNLKYLIVTAVNLPLDTFSMDANNV